MKLAFLDLARCETGADVVEARIRYRNSCSSLWQPLLLQRIGQLDNLGLQGPLALHLSPAGRDANVSTSGRRGHHVRPRAWW